MTSNLLTAPVVPIVPTPSACPPALPLGGMGADRSPARSAGSAAPAVIAHGVPAAQLAGSGAVPHAASPPRRSAALARWETDWQWWVSRPHGPASVAAWTGRHPCLAGCGSLQGVLEACGADRSVGVEVADRRLAAVVAEAVAGDGVAARVALQRVLSGLAIRAAARARRHRIAFDAAIDELTATAWTVITEYPVRRRPTKLAVNILMDSDHRAFEARAVDPVRQPVPVAPSELWRHRPVTGPAGEATSSWGQPERVLDELLQVLLEAVRQGFDSTDARLLVELFVLDLTPAELAARDGVSERWVRQRRRDAIDRLARHVHRGRHGTARIATAGHGSGRARRGAGERK